MLSFVVWVGVAMMNLWQLREEVEGGDKILPLALEPQPEQEMNSCSEKMASHI